MAETTHCERCGGPNPHDARFCIDCGASLAPATTGPTTRLAGVACPVCGTENPEAARFCVVCGRGLVAGAPPPRTAAPPRPRLAPQQSFPRVQTPPAPTRMAPPSAPAWPAQRTQPRKHQSGALIFVIGLFLLAASHTIWPGILLLVGIYSLVNASNHGRMDKALMSIIWWGGLAFLFSTGMFWPGIVLLVLLSAVAGNWTRPRSRRYW